jgi:hypothetical protein
MRKALVTTLLFSLLISSTIFVVMVSANPHIGPIEPSFYIHSPRYSMNNTNAIPLNFTVEVIGDWDYNNCSRQVWYNLDGQGNISVPLTYQGQEKVMGYPSSLVSGVTTLPDLTGFQHTIKLFARYDYGKYVLTGHTSYTFYAGLPPNYSPTSKNLLLGATIVLAMVASFSLVIYFGYRRRKKQE